MQIIFHVIIRQLHQPQALASRIQQGHAGIALPVALHFPLPMLAVHIHRPLVRRAEQAVMLIQFSKGMGPGMALEIVHRADNVFPTRAEFAGDQ